MKPIEVLLNQGLNTADGEENIAPGELASGIGIYYKIGDQARAHKIEGKTEFGQVISSGFNTPVIGSGELIIDPITGTVVFVSGYFTPTPVRGIVAAVYDEGISQLVAYAGSGIYTADLGATGTFTLLSSGEWGASGLLMGGIHNDDRWYLYNGADRNQVMPVPTFDVSGHRISGSLRGHGMLPPNASYPAATGLTVSGTLFAPTAVDGSGIYVNRGYYIINGYFSHAWYRGTNGSPTSFPDAWNLSEGLTPGPYGLPFLGPDQWGFPVNIYGSIHYSAEANHWNGTPYWISGSAAYDNSTSGTFDETTWAESRSWYTTAGGPTGWHVIKFSGFASSTAVDRKIQAKVTCFRNAGGNGAGFADVPRLVGEFSEDHGTTWEPFGETKWTEGNTIKNWSSRLLVANNDHIEVRFLHLWCNKNDFQSAARIYDVRVVNGGLADPGTVDEVVAIQYDYTERDDNTLFFGQPLESIVANRRGTTTPIFVSGLGGVRLTLPLSPQNKNTTGYNIYRTPISGVAFQDYTLVGQIGLPKISGRFYAPGETLDTFTWQDDFSVPVDDVGIKPYATIRVVDEFFHRDETPQAFVHINYFQGSFVGVALDKPRALFYTPQGLVESNPLPYIISAFPMPEHDFLMGTMTVGATLVILADGGIMTMDELPLTDENGVLTTSPNIRRMDNVPGCVGHRAFTTMSIDGPLNGAWVSRVGVHVTDGTNTIRLSNDLDWESAVNVATLNTAILSYDQDRQLLVLDFDSDGDQINDKTFFFHVSKDHQKGSGRPKITGPHYRSATSTTRGTVSGTPLIYTGNPNGKVYLEWSGTIDTSNTYNVSGIVPMQVKTGKVYDNANYLEYRVFKAVVQHSHFGDSGTLLWNYGRDKNGFSDTLSKNVNLSGTRNTEVFIGRQQEWSQLRLEHYGSGIGSIGRIKLISQSEGDI